ncbi:type VI secretion system baseplate subunit TssK [Francisella philomiragia]|uniref:type VI secretion system baseplate subunit TssK n=1 Tax=Francisella philomiragia TaxID=28110 RepID=UPI001C9DA6A3|nr:type VI secretion system baseplate subunit TssK [Francisella philomiragia]MBY7735064.1 type VI secretion system baseplate subunit TssK [Francisella philomiragia]
MKRVAWFSGLTVSQQHFQLQDTLFESAQQELVRGGRHCYGLKNIEVDEAKLEQGIISITKCEAILPDGTIINIPDVDGDEISLQLDETCVNKTVYLAISPIPKNARLFSETKLSATTERYYMSKQTVSDAMMGAEKSIELSVLKLNMYLIIDTSNFQEFILLPVAKISSVSSNKTVLLDKAYIPPLLNIFASNRLKSILKNVFMLAQQRKKQIMQRLKNVDEYGTAGLIEMLFVQLLNRYIPIVEHIYNSSRVHPEELFKVLLQFSSELRTFTHEDKGYNEYIKYKHENLTEIFSTLSEDLKEAFACVFEERAIRIPLSYFEKYALYIANVESIDLTNISEWSFVIACKTEMPKDQLALTFPKIIKIASKSQISNVVSKQLPGIKVVSMASSPKQIPFMSDYVYFELDRNSDFWKSIYESKIMSMYLTRKFSQIDIQLWATKR